MNVNFLSNPLLPTAFLAVTTATIISAPAQAFTLKGSTTITDILVEVNDNLASPDNNAIFNFYPSRSVQLAFQSASTGTFDDGDQFVSIANSLLSITGGTLDAPLEPFISNIDTTSPEEVSFVLTSISNYLEQFGATPGTKQFSFNLHGYFVTNAGDIMGSGVFASTVNTTNGRGSMSTTLVTNVPTPAAVLPVLGGLLGFASKRKQREENA